MQPSDMGQEDSRRNGLRKFVVATCSQLHHNAKLSGRYLALDSSTLVICFVLFEANELLIKPWYSSPDGDLVGYLLQCHANDFLGGTAFLAYTNLLIDLVKPDVRFERLPTILVFIFLCGLFWELVAPAFLADSVGDPFDLIAYMLGGCLYWALSMAAGRDRSAERR